VVTKFRGIRFYIVFSFLLLSFFLLLGRLSLIQIFNARYLKNLARKQHSLYVELEPRRGTIYDRRLRPQTINISAQSLFACPEAISNKEKVIKKIQPILNLDYDYLRDRLYREKSFVWLGRKLQADIVKQIKALNIKGLGFVKEARRAYPNRYLGSHIIGFAGLDNVGLEGLELAYDFYLRGSAGWGIFVRDGRQRKLDLPTKLVLPHDGHNVILTVDEAIQYIAERELDKVYKAFKAKGASIVVMDPSTGEILALANRPTFDPNNILASQKDNWRNRAICDLFEPGSVFKIVTAAAALQEGKVKEADKFFCENGAYRIVNHILHDHRPHGWLTFSQVIEQSSNIGTTKVAQILGKDLLWKYIKLFGFGSPTGVDLPGEIAGMVRPAGLWSRISIGAVPIGQEVGVTALQLACAISVIANGGLRLRPYIVKQIRDNQGEVIKEFKPVVINRVISASTAARVKEILVKAVENGTARLAKIKNCRVAGKTGTAQKIDSTGRYSHHKFVASFIGFAPADAPRIAICVVVDEPHPYYFGGVVCAPVFKNVARDVLRYLEIAPKENADYAFGKVN
jgi:cell division protein FtsI (penicillin-binding protein 3)